MAGRIIGSSLKVISALRLQRVTYKKPIDMSQYNLSLNIFVPATRLELKEVKLLALYPNPKNSGPKPPILFPKPKNK